MAAARARQRRSAAAASAARSAPWPHAALSRSCFGVDVDQHAGVVDLDGRAPGSARPGGARLRRPSARPVRNTARPKSRPGGRADRGIARRPRRGGAARAPRPAAWSAAPAACRPAGSASPRRRARADARGDRVAHAQRLAARRADVGSTTTSRAATLLARHGGQRRGGRRRPRAGGWPSRGAASCRARSAYAPSACASLCPLPA